MSSGYDMQLIAQDDGEAIDDCWNRIGVHGDKQCPLLERHIHCRNCEVHAAAATRLLDRYAQVLDEQEQTLPLSSAQSGAPCCCSGWVRMVGAGHGLPGRNRPAAAGAFVAASTLARAAGGGQRARCAGAVPVTGGLLSVPGEASSERGGQPCRMLITAAQGGPVVVPVEEIDGIHRLDPGQLHEGRDTAHFTAAVLQWQGRSVRVLDEQHLLQAVKRSLS
jgi:chemotaxis-related protein WspD